MAPRVRRSSDTNGIAGVRGLGRRWLALVLVFISLVSAYLVFSRDVEWRERQMDARRLGMTAENNGNFQAARRHYETALANHPYDWESHLALAEVLNYRLGEYEDALRHYLYGLAYSPEPAIVEPTKRKIAILRLIRSGELEDPRSAVEDMFRAVETRAEIAFGRRLSLELRDKTSTFWQAWEERGRGEVRYVRVLGERDGFFDATVELDFPASETNMSVRLQCPLRDIWRVNLSFP